MAAIRQGSPPRVQRGGQSRRAVVARPQWAFCRGDFGGDYYRRVLTPAVRSTGATRSSAIEGERR